MPKTSKDEGGKEMVVKEGIRLSNLLPTASHQFRVTPINEKGRALGPSPISNAIVPNDLFEEGWNDHIFEV